MSLYAKLGERAANGKPLVVGLIGAGKFGAMYLAQVPKTPGVHVAAIADLAPANARANLARIGWTGERFSAASIDAALKSEDVAEVSRLAQRGVQVATVATKGTGDDDLDTRVEAVRAAIPAAGLTTFRDVRLNFQGIPAPSHVIEASGGETRWRLDAGELVLGNVPVPGS